MNFQLFRRLAHFILYPEDIREHQMYGIGSVAKENVVQAATKERFVSI